MVHKTLAKLDGLIGFERARAHCDIPCGIYDPIIAQIAALTVVRMIDLMTEYAAGQKQQNIEFQNAMSRYIAVKEEHAEKVKHEVRIIWGDFVKPHHVEKHPEVHGIAHKIMQLGSQCRQSADREAAVQLVAAVNDFAELFWKIKEVATKRAKAPYAPGLELVYPGR